MASSEIVGDENSQNFNVGNKSMQFDTSIKSAQSDGDLFPELSFSSSTDSELKLSHSAAKHKMAIRPKKKGPTRPPRRSNEVRADKKQVFEFFLK